MGIDDGFWMGLREIPSRSRAPAAKRRKGVHQRERERPCRSLEIAKRLHRLGFPIEATSGTAGYSAREWVACEDGEQGQGRTAAYRGPYQEWRDRLVVNTVGKAASHADSLSIRREALQ